MGIGGRSITILSSSQDRLHGERFERGEGGNGVNIWRVRVAQAEGMASAVLGPKQDLELFIQPKDVSGAEPSGAQIWGAFLATVRTLAFTQSELEPWEGFKSL